MNAILKPGLVLVAVASIGAPVEPSQAQQSASDGALEEIIVSARKRDESLQSVPIAVDVFTRARLDQLAIQNVQDVARFTSGLTFDQGLLPTDTRPVIRGVNAQRGRPNVGVLVDFVDVSSEALTVAGGGITTNLRLLDLERVEIVKGPQSALYGRSAFTGAINYVTKRPSETFEAEARVDWDEWSTTDIRLLASGPLTDNLRGRVIFSKYDTDGWYTNPNTGGELGAADSIGGALGLEWDISDRVSTYFRAEYTEDDFTPRAESLLTSMSPQFDPNVNFLGTGTVNDNAVMFPHQFTGTEVCNTIDRQQPYYDSFNFGMGPLGQPCRPLLVGEVHGTEADIDLNPDPRTGTDFNGTDVDTARVHFDVNVDITDDTTLSYILGYLDNDTHLQEDFTRTTQSIVSAFNPFPPPGSTFSQYGLMAMAEQHLETTQWNHELRLSGSTERSNWMVSALYWEEEMDLQFDDEWWLRDGGDAGAVLALFNQGPFSYLDGNPPFVPSFCTLFYPGNPDCVNDVTFIATGPGNTPAIPINRETEHWSIAGLYSFNVTDSFIVTVEGRYLDETIDYTGDAADVSFYSQFGQDPWWGFLFGPGLPTANTVEADKFVPKVTLDWAASEDILLYGYYSEAFKPGGVTTTDANGDVSNGEYKPEELDVWEAGFKSSFRENSIRWNGAVFFYDYTNQQVPFQTVSPTTGLLQTFVVNAGKTEVTGFETDLVWNSQLLEGLSASIGYTHTDSEFTSFNLAEILAEVGGTPSAFNRAKAGNEDADFTGKTPPLTPENAATATLRYDWNFARSMFGYVELLGKYQDKRYISEGNRSYLPSYTLLDIYAGLGNDRWALTLWVQNATDEDKIQSAIANIDFTVLPDGRSLPQASNVFLPQPRTFGARLQVNFGD